MNNNKKTKIASIIGAQWGDEGKGKIVDFLISEGYDFVCRFSGGNNAGHTLVVDGKKYKFSILPSGAIHSGQKLVIGTGCLINLELLAKEWAAALLINSDLELYISESAHVIMPYHIAIDGKEEQLRSGKLIGTTKQGIGPCMMDKVGRFGFKIGEFLKPKAMKAKLITTLAAKNLVFKSFYGIDSYDATKILADFAVPFAALKDHIVNLQELFQNHPDASIIFEGAQGTLLDPDFGSYPFVTSTSTTQSAITLGNLQNHNATKSMNRWGVFKAYSTRVGAGSFVTSMDAESAQTIAALGFEVGVVSGRPRKIGWFDVVLAAYSIQVNGFNKFAFTILDALTGIKTLKVCVAYNYNGKKTTVFHPLADESEIKPIYVELPGWSEPIGQLKSYADLPVNAQKYIEFIEKQLNIKFDLFSVGPERKETFYK